MAISLFSACTHGITPHTISVEVDVSPGLAQFIIVGLADTAIQESKQRVRFALRNSGMQFPRQKKVVNLAPAQVHKHGSGFDLPIALGLLAVSGQIRIDTDHKILIIGELGLDGAIHPVRGILPIVLHARDEGFTQIILPAGNLAEAEHISDIALFPCKNLYDALSVLRGKIKPHISSKNAQPNLRDTHENPFSDIKGQLFAQRALVIAAAGGHHILLSGPPGCGKSLLGQCFHALLPPLSYNEALETSIIHSVAGTLPHGSQLVWHPPLQVVHHTISRSALIGGGSQCLPGAISLAHNGILLIDEIAEFSPQTINALRQPLEKKQVLLHRMKMITEYPCNFQLIATMNPCPCGYAYDDSDLCHCSESIINRYQRKITGPLLDRIDLFVQMQRISHNQLVGSEKNSDSGDIITLIHRARTVQYTRQGCLNADLNSGTINSYCSLHHKSKAFITQAIRALTLTGRSYDSAKKVARTIADLEGSTDISEQHFAEALQYRKS